MTRVIADALREHGYLHPAIVPHPKVEHAPDRATLVFAIEPGPRTTIGRIDVVGRPSVPQAAFLSRLGLTVGEPYQPEALNARIERTRGAPEARHYEAKLLPGLQLVDDDRVANLTLTVSSVP